MKKKKQNAGWKPSIAENGAGFLHRFFYDSLWQMLHARENWTYYRHHRAVIERGYKKHT